MSYHLFYPSIGGGEQAILEVGKRLVKNGHEVTVVTSSSKFRKPIDYVDGIKVVSCKSWFNLFKSPFMPGFFWKILKEDCDVVNANLTVPFTSDVTCLAAKLRGKPLLITYHFDGNASGVIGSTFAWLYNHTFNKLSCWFAKKIIATTKSYAETSPILKNYLDSDKLSIIPYGVNTELFNPKIRSTEVKKLYKLKKGKVILFVGRLIPYKGIELLLKAMQGVDAKLLIVGDGELKKELHKQVKKLGVDKKVIFTGAISNEHLPQFYVAADIFVLPSQKRGEAFGLVSLEALASGKPVIHSNMPGVNEVVPSNCGLVFYNVDDLTKKINFLLKNRKLRKKFGDNGRRFVEKERSWDITAEKYEKFIIRVHNMKRWDDSNFHKMVN